MTRVKNKKTFTLSRYKEYTKNPNMITKVKNWKKFISNSYN